MATYYGQTQGNGTAATRTGTKTSGIKSSVQSYKGSVIVSLYNDKITIEIAKDSSFKGSMIFYGSIEELEKKLKGA